MARARSQVVSIQSSPVDCLGCFSRFAPTPSGVYITDASCPPRVDDSPWFTEQSLSGRIMMLCRRPSLPEMTLCIAGVITTDWAGSWERKSSPRAFCSGARPPSRFASHL